jgi:hypothetical protein
MALKRIISSGEAGVERAALDIGVKLLVDHGGWIKKGRETESGILSYNYKMQEMEILKHLNPAKCNVLDSDGTLIISRGEYKAKASTKTLCKKQKKPIIHTDLLENPKTITYGKNCRVHID